MATQRYEVLIPRVCKHYLNLEKGILQMKFSISRRDYPGFSRWALNAIKNALKALNGLAQ